MSRRLPPLNALKAFEAAARHEHVGRAAIDLHVTHSAVSHHIRALEEMLEVQLFVRVGRNLKLTEAGQFLLPTVRQALDSIAEAVSQIKAPPLGGRLAVACAPGFCAKWLVPRLGRFTTQHPRIELIVETLAQAVREPPPGADVTVLPGMGKWAGRHVRLLTEVESFPVCSPAWLAAHPMRGPADLLTAEVLQYALESKFERWMLAHGLTGELEGRAIRFSTAHHAVDAAVAGLGIAMGDNILAGDDLEAGRLVRPFRARLPATYGYYAICDHDARNATMVGAFVDWMIAEFAACGPVRTVPAEEEREPLRASAE